MKGKVTIISRFCIVAPMVAAFSFAGLALAQESPAGKSSSLSAKDKTFIHKAAKGGMMEVAMGNLAAQNGQSDGVKSLGKRMVTVNSKDNDELKSYTAKNNVIQPRKAPHGNTRSDIA